MVLCKNFEIVNDALLRLYVKRYQKKNKDQKLYEAEINIHLNIAVNLTNNKT